MMMRIEPTGQVWFNRIDNLLNDLSILNDENLVLIAKDIDKGGKKKFTYFEDYVDTMIYINNAVKTYGDCFHEILLNNKDQVHKLYFDIDYILPNENLDNFDFYTSEIEGAMNKIIPFVIHYLFSD
jgi:hypothetical protein